MEKKHQQKNQRKGNGAPVKQAPQGKTYRRKQPSLKPDQPLPQLSDGRQESGLQHAFCSPVDHSVENQGFDACQENYVEEDHSRLLQNNAAASGALHASAGKASFSAEERASKPSQKGLPHVGGLKGDDSDSCDFNEIDNEIQDTLLHRSFSSEEEQVVRASKRSVDPMPERDFEEAEVQVVDPTQIKPLLHQQRAETTSTSDSMVELQMSENMSPFEDSEATWCVNMLPESVFVLGNLQDFVAHYGKVLAVVDIQDQSIQVQYEGKSSALLLQKALSERQIDSQVIKLSCARGCQITQKKLFDGADPELTLKLLKISPKVDELAIQRSDSEFLNDYNSTARQQTLSSQVVISTEGSDNLSTQEGVSLEQATKWLAQEQPSSEVNYLFAPNLAKSQGPNAATSHVLKSSQGVIERMQSPTGRATIHSDHKMQLRQSRISAPDICSNESCSMIGSEEANPFRNSSAIFHPQKQQVATGQTTNFGNLSTPSLQYENDQFSKQQANEVPFTHRKFNQCFQSDSSHQSEPHQVNPFGSSGIHSQPEEVPMSAMISSQVSTFYPTPQASISHSKHGGHTDPQFQVNLDRILCGEDSRTTIMIRHIPNKYTEEMLLERINRKHKGRYDFFYLPLDLNNGCNIGYAFINFIDPVYIVPFYEDLNNQTWETFNSEKICQIAYGRIQGKRNLVENVNKQPETRKIKPLIMDVHQNGGNVERVRNALLAQRQNQREMQAYPAAQNQGSGIGGFAPMSGRRESMGAPSQHHAYQYRAFH